MPLSLGDVFFDLSARTDGLDSAQRKMRDFATQADQTANRVYTDTKKMSDGIDGMSKAAGTLTKVLGTLGLVTSFGGLVQFVQSAIASAAALHDMADEIGLSVERLQVWQRVAEQSGASTEQLNNGLEAFSRNIGNVAEGVKGNVDQFNRWGVYIKDSSGQMRSFSDLLTIAADRIATLRTHTEQVAAATDLFGKQGVRLLPTLLQMARAEQQATDEARRLGLVMSTETADAADRMDNRLHDLNRSLSNETVQSLNDVGKALDGLQSKFTNFQTSPISGTSWGDWIVQQLGGQKVEDKARELMRGVGHWDQTLGPSAATLLHQQMGADQTTGIGAPWLGGGSNPPAASDVDKAAAALKRLNDELARSGTLMADAQAEWEALTEGVDAYDKAVTQTQIDKQVDQMTKALQKAGDAQDDVDLKAEMYRETLTRIAELKPYTNIVDGIRKAQDEIADLSNTTSSYISHLRELQKLGPSALEMIAKELGVASANSKDLAMAMSDLDDQVKVARYFSGAIDDMTKQLSHMVVETVELSSTWSEASRYMKDPALEQSLHSYATGLVLVKNYTVDQAAAAELAARKIIDANTSARESYQRMADMIDSINNDLGQAFSQLSQDIMSGFQGIKSVGQELISIMERLLEAIMQDVLEAVLLKPLEKSIAGGLGSLFGAKGLVMQGGSVIPMAKGGVLSGPTVIPLAGGAAIASEYGQNEAVMPLKRTSHGDLGVSASGMGFVQNIEIVNNASPDVQVTTKSSRSGRGDGMNDLVIMVSKVVSRDIRSGGPVGQSIATMFNTNQRVTSRG